MAKYEIKDGVGVIPEGTTTIESNMFKEKEKLTSVIIPDSVNVIGQYAFSGTGLKSINIPNSVKEIQFGAFKDCKDLTSITIPDSVTKIMQWAFCGCTGLESVTIGESVSDIGVRVFEGSNGLKSIVVAKGNKIYDSRNNCNAIIET